MVRKLLLLLCLSLICVGLANANFADYKVTVRENGEALVIISINGTGLYKIPLQDDVKDIKVRGALYSLSNQTAKLSIGSMGKAIVVYKTDAMITRQKDNWKLELKTAQTDVTNATINLPPNINIKKITPEAELVEGEYKMIEMAGNITDIRIEYSFNQPVLPDINPTNESYHKPVPVNISITPVRQQFVPGDKSHLSFTLLLIISSLLLVNAALLFRWKKGIKRVRTSNRQNVLKTLAKNEELIVNILTENNNSIRRNIMEKKSKIAKSSLACSLKSLENKGIVEIDRTYKTHFIKLTKWFEDL